MSSNIRASCYLVNVSTTALTGLHYSTTGGSSGIPEVGSRIPSPPESPPLAATTTARELEAALRKGSPSTAGGKAGAAHKITEECERLFCEDLRTVFLGERITSGGSLVIGATTTNNNYAGANTVPGKNIHGQGYFALRPMPEMTPPEELTMLYGAAGAQCLVQEYLEMWDYMGGTRFRGFTARSSESLGEKTLFVFFDRDVLGKELKQGLMALMELATTPSVACDRLAVCVDRSTSETETAPLVRDLGWVGFEPMTLDVWAGFQAVTSEKWLFMGMDV